MITLFDKFKKNKNDKDDRYVIICFVSKNKKHIINTSEDDDNYVTVLSASSYYNIDKNDVRIFNKNNVDKFVKLYNKRYNYYKFEKMKYEDYILDIETNKYNL